MFKGQEFTEEEKKAFEVIKLDAEDLGAKTPSQRLRAVLYRYWEQDPKGHDSFPLYYEYMMSKLIESVKNKLDK